MPAPSIDDPDLTLLDLFQAWPETAKVFFEQGMLCFGCPIAPFHTVIDACVEYRLDEEAFRARLREAASQPA
jgi:hybrid cluster-associated redox disulfide protein